MSRRADHHFVPQYYFRHFSTDKRRIHLLHLQGEKVILNAPIRGQAQRANFYGAAEIEQIISRLESDHAWAIRSALHAAYTGNVDRLYQPETFANLWNAVLVQRSRTPSEASKVAPPMEQFCLQEFRAYLERRDDIDRKAEMLRAFDDGTITINYGQTRAALMALSSALEATILISDLGLYLLRNQTDYPFVFSDAPVVLLNQHLMEVKYRGVLGLQTPGLQIFLPIAPGVALMLLDESVYGGRYKDSVFVDVVERSDVSQLNALQVHQATNALYFGHEQDAGYVEALWRAHKPTVQQQPNEFRHFHRVDNDADADDGPVELFHSFEPQLNFSPDFTFLEFTPLPVAEYEFRRRDPNLVAEYDRRTGHQREKKSGALKPVLFRDQQGRELIVDVDQPTA